MSWAYKDCEVCNGTGTMMVTENYPIAHQAEAFCTSCIIRKRIENQNPDTPLTPINFQQLYIND